ncbi:peptidase [Parapedobacter pyrenivorans]|uniref:Peptidase n=2 Tax=Parapedobacter pyrenivorans TaxID=1305674 RepID=A0A917HQ21_9SPHI|nr:peptidase [Parapedobacter pyrenivorans]
MDSLKIVAFGNSITARRATVDTVWADRLPYLLADAGITATLINSGVGSSHSGRLVDNDFAKVRHALDRFETDVLDHHPDLVIISFGSNDAYIDDGNPAGASRISLEKFKANLSFMIKELKRRNVRVLLAAPPPFVFGKVRQYQNKRLQQYVEAVRKLSKMYQVGLADNYRIFSKYAKEKGGYGDLFPDGVHPNDEGHAMIAENIAITIDEMIDQ